MYSYLIFYQYFKDRQGKVTGIGRVAVTTRFNLLDPSDLDLFNLRRVETELAYEYGFFDLISTNIIFRGMV